MNRNKAACRIILAVGVTLLGSTVAHAQETACRLDYEMRGWSFVYKTYRGGGTVHCENGESAAVSLVTHGGGATLGKSTIKGRGRFSGVTGINEVFGTYVEAGAHAGVVRSVDARVLTKGEVSLALGARGRGVDLGVAFGVFKIRPR